MLLHIKCCAIAQTTIPPNPFIHLFQNRMPFRGREMSQILGE